MAGGYHNMEAKPVAAKMGRQNVAGVLRGLNKKVQGEDSHACGQKTPPENGSAVE